MKLKQEKPRTAVDALVSEARHRWAHWPQTQDEEISAYLCDYLRQQLTSQLAEALSLRPQYIESLKSFLNTQNLKPERVSQIVGFSESYGLQSRYYPSYLPDMNAMLEYTFRAIKGKQQPGAREMIEAINQKLFLELAKDPILCKAIGLIPDTPQIIGINLNEPKPPQKLTEVSRPQPPFEKEYFIRTWQMQDIGKGNWKWEVTNYSIPLPSRTDQIAEPTDRLAGFNTWFTPRYLGLEELLIESTDTEQLKEYSELANLVMIDDTQQTISLAQMFRNINPEVNLNPEDLKLVADFIGELIQIDIEKILPFLTKIIKHLTEPLNPDLLRSWEQLFVIMLLRYCTSDYAAQALGHDLEIDANQRLWLISEDALLALANGQFKEASAKETLPSWLSYPKLDTPQKPHIKVDDIHSYFDSSDITIQIESAKLDKELLLADLMT